jgi:hypothetical protein
LINKIEAVRTETRKRDGIEYEIDEEISSPFKGVGPTADINVGDERGFWTEYD